MDEVVNRFARELADAIAASVADDSRVEACRTRAREAGYDMRVTLEAVVGFINRTKPGQPAKVATPARSVSNHRPAEMTASDRRFLRSLLMPTFFFSLACQARIWSWLCLSCASM